MGYPDMRVTGDNYNPGGGRVQMSQLIGVIKMLVIAMVLFKFNPWTYLGYEVAGPTPNMVTWALENKIYACMMTFFLCNMVEKLREQSKQVGGMDEVDFRDEL